MSLAHRSQFGTVGLLDSFEDELHAAGLIPSICPTSHNESRQIKGTLAQFRKPILSRVDGFQSMRNAKNNRPKSIISDAIKKPDIASPSPSEKILNSRTPSPSKALESN